MIVANDQQKYFGVYRGEVKNNLDTKQFGRIQVEVLPMMQGIETQYLPWCVPAYSLFDGSGDGFGTFVVPKVGSWVYVMFEEGDFNQPLYFAEAASGTKGQPSARTTHYPNRKVTRTKNGIQFTIDDEPGEQMIDMLHPTGTRITVDKEGNGIATVVKNITGDVTENIIIRAGDSILIQAYGNATITSTGSMNITSSAGITVQGATVSINP